MMIFKISRTSSYYDETPPCDKAFKTTFPRFDIRTCSEEEYNETRREKWQERGKNHTVLSNGHISRQLEDIEGWGIEINSLEELLELSKKYGEIIVSCDAKNVLEIYDDYRE